MNAVLPTPNLPTLINLEDLKTYIDNEIEKGIEKALPAAIEKVLSDPENPLFIKAVESVLAISDLKILKRLYDHDVLFGLREPYEDEDVVSIHARIEALEQKALIATEKPIESITSEIPIIPKTTLERKATELVTRITGKIKPGKNEVFMDNAELNNFFKSELPEELKSNDTNLRRVKKRVMEKAKQLFPDNVFISKSKYGRHETRIVFKQSYQYNRNGTLV
jgi:hypothetical protein